MRKALYILSILIACTLITLGMSVCFLRSSSVQTSLVRLATDELSRALGTTAHIGHIEYRFPARLRLDSIFLADQQGDTLAFVGEAYAHFSPLALGDHTLRFRRIDIHGVKADIHRLENGQYNYQFLVNAFASNDKEDDPSDSTTLRLDFGAVELLDLDVRYDQHRLSLEQLTVPHLVVAGDSIYTTARIRHATYNSEVRLEACELSIATLDTLLLHVEKAQYKDLRFSGDFGGRMDSLTATNLLLTHRDKHILDGDIFVSGLPNIDSTYLHAQCRDLHLRPGVIQDVVSDLTGKPFVLPEQLHRLGNMHYRGLLDGRLTQLNLKGAFSSALGTITTDGTLTGTSDFKQLQFTGALASRRFRLGTMLGQKDMGNMSFSITARGGYTPAKPFYIHGHGHVGSFTYRDYTYRDLCMQVGYEDDELNAHLSLNDEHVSLSLEALADWGEEKQISLHLALPTFQPGPLGLNEDYQDATLSLTLDAEAYFHTVEDLIGYIHMDSIRWLRPALEDSMLVESLDLQLESEQDHHHRLLMTSDLATARVEGTFDYASLPTTFLKLGIRYLPSLFSPAKQEEILSRPSANRFDAYVYGHQLQKLQYMLDWNMRLGDYPVLKITVDEPNDIWALQGFASEFKTSKQQWYNITLSADNHSDRANVSLSAEYARGKYLLQSYAHADSLLLSIRASGDSSIMRGELMLSTHFRRYAGQPLIEANFYPSSFTLMDSVFHIDASHLQYCVADTTLSIRHFRIGTTTQYVEADGVVSHNERDSLHVRLSDINASAIMPFVVPERTIVVNGLVSGKASLYGILSKPMFACDVLLKQAGLNNCILGDAKAKVYLAESGKDIVIEADIDREDHHRVAHVDGAVDLRPEAKSHWELAIRPDSIPLGFISHWTSGIIDDIGGTASGVVNVFGIKGSVWVTAAVQPHQGHLTIPYTGCTYYINDSCFMDSTSIRFPNMTLRDEEGNPMYLDGVLTHQCFKDFKFDIGLSMDHALAINMPDKAGEMIQGKVYASGKVRVLGDDHLVTLNADAKTTGASRFRLSIDGAGTAADNGFIHFVDHNVVHQQSDKKDYGIRVHRRRHEYTHLPPKFIMGLNIEGTRDLNFQLMLNDKTGDMIQARGEGALRLTYDASQNEFKLMGTYSILEGQIGFTLAGAFRRNFTIAQGSQIAWNGDPANPTLNVTAKYHLTASLKDLFGSEASTLVTSRTSIPVNTCISMNGTLTDSRIRFGLEFPLSEEAIRTQVASVINTEEMMMRQVIYLLVFGKFFTPDYMRSSGQHTGLNETYSLLSSTVTGQINAWINKLTDVFTMGINIRTDGEGSSSQQEYEANFQIQPIPRLAINGNVGYRYNDLTNRPFFGDLEVEYMLTPTGKVRVKAYTHTVDKYSLRQASTIQGVGFVFRHDFNWPKIGARSKE